MSVSSQSSNQPSIAIITAPAGGGGGVAAMRLHSNLLKEEATVATFSLTLPGNPTIENVLFFPGSTVINRLKRRARRQLISYRSKELQRGISRIEMFSTMWAEYGSEFSQQCPPADVYNIHWVTDFLDLPSWIDQLSSTCHVVWTLHDMNPFTGGCHYDDGCGRHRQACGECPQLAKPLVNDLSARQLKDKIRILAPLIDSNRLHIVALCSWMANEAKESRLFRDVPVHVIPNGIDTREFKPLDRLACRVTLGIPESSTCLLFVCGNLNNYRKGFDLFQQSLAHLESEIEDQLTILLIGGGFENHLRHRHPNILFRAIGRVHDPHLLQAAYSAADIHVLPTRADNLPNTIMEAMSCGTPSVAFDVGGIPDMIIPGETGELAEPLKPVSLAKAICRLSKRSNKEMRKHCREFAVKNFDASIQAKKYIELFSSVHDGK